MIRLYLMEKNIIHFLLLYAIGDTLSCYSDSLSRIKTKTLVFLFIIINLGMVVFFSFVWNTSLYHSLWFIADNNNGPILMVNAIVTFLLFLRIKIRSKAINYLAASVLAIYIIQQEPYLSSCLSRFFSKVWEIPMLYDCHGLKDTLFLIGYLMCKTLFFMTAGLIIDKILSPLWRFIDKQARLLPAIELER